ncbi:unnamed protein product [Lampetra planeri]
MGRAEFQPIQLPPNSRFAPTHRRVRRGTWAPFWRRRRNRPPFCASCAKVGPHDRCYGRDNGCRCSGRRRWYDRGWRCTASAVYATDVAAAPQLTMVSQLDAGLEATWWPDVAAVAVGTASRGAGAAYPDLEGRGLDSLALERLLALAGELGIVLSIPEEAKITSLAVAHNMQAHLALRTHQWRCLVHRVVAAAAGSSAVAGRVQGVNMRILVDTEPPQVEPTATDRTAGMPATDMGPAGTPSVLLADAARSSGRAADASPVPPPMVPTTAPTPTLADGPAACPVPASTPPVPTTDGARGGGPAAHTRSRGVRIR